MSLISIFLAVLVIALIIGITVLNFTKPKKQNSRTSENVLVFNQEMQNLQSNIKAMDELIKMAHSRISELEAVVKASEKLGNSKDLIIKLGELQTRLSHLEAFKENTKIDMIALREISLEMKDLIDEKKSEEFLSRAQETENNLEAKQLLGREN